MATNGKTENGTATHVKMPGQESLERPLPKRFYTDVAAVAGSGGYAIELDGRPVRTPGKRALAVPAEPLASAIAEEWRAQVEVIDPATMPLTKIANTGLDGVADKEAEVRAEIVSFAGNDLTCYRAEHPQELVARQAAAWDPVLTWARDACGIELKVASGIMPVAQSEAALAAAAAAWREETALSLAACHVLVTLSGSNLLALAMRRGHLDADAAWTAAHIDEDWQISQWGEDAEAQARRAWRRQEFGAAAEFLRLLG